MPIALLCVVAAAFFLCRRTVFGSGLASYLLTRRVPIRGTVASASIKGPITGYALRYLIYLPGGYEATDQNYNTIYHLHGAFPLPWEKIQRFLELEINRLASSLEQAVESGRIEPAIIVVPYDGGGQSMWADSKDGRMPVETSIVRELIPHIDEGYRTRADRSGRVLQGFSMGGFGAMKNVLKYPETFSAAVSYDGALHSWHTLTKNRKNIANRVFQNDPEYFDQYSPWSHSQQAKQFPLLLCSNVGLLKAYNRAFRAHMDKIAVPMTYVETSCGHDLFCLLGKVGQRTFELLGSHLRDQKG